jgi:hypothetical protein
MPDGPRYDNLVLFPAGGMVLRPTSPAGLSTLPA